MDLQDTYQVQTTSHTIARILLSPALLHMYVHRNTMPPLPASAMDEGLAETTWVSITVFPTNWDACCSFLKGVELRMLSLTGLSSFQFALPGMLVLYKQHAL